MPPHGHGHHGGHHGGHHHGGGRRGGSWGGPWGDAWGYPTELVQIDSGPDCSQWTPKDYQIARAAKNAGLITGRPCLDSAYDPTRAKPQATSGILDWITGSPIDVFLSADCKEKSAAKLKDFNTRITTIRWLYYPPPMFTWAQVDTVIGQLLALSKIATDAIETANREFSSQTLLDVQMKIFSTIGAQANLYLAAKKPVAGSEMKDWILASLHAAADGLAAMYTSVCSRPWWFSMLSSFQGAFDKVWNFIAGIGAGIKKVIEYWTYVKIGAAGLIAYMIYNEYSKRRTPSRRARRR